MASGKASHSKQSSSKQQHAGWFGNSCLLSARNLTSQGCNLPWIDREVVYREKERANTASRLLSWYGRRPAVRIVEREKDRRIIEVNKYTALSQAVYRTD